MYRFLFLDFSFFLERTMSSDIFPSFRIDLLRVDGDFGKGLFPIGEDLGEEDLDSIGRGFGIIYIFDSD